MLQCRQSSHRRLGLGAILVGAALDWASAAGPAEDAAAGLGPAEGAVRLAGGNTDAGRVEVFFQGRWGWICLDGAADAAAWTRSEAEVVCKQLGLRRGVGTMLMANGLAGDRLPVARARCGGSEATLADCRLELRGAAGAAGAACGQDSPLPAAAGVRCTNFVPEEQPQVVVDGEAMQGLLTEASLRIACASEPVAQASPQGLPSFACTVLRDAAPAAPAGPAACADADAAAGGGDGAVCPASARVRGGGGCAAAAADEATTTFEASALEAFVFPEAMVAHLTRAREQRAAGLPRHRAGLASLRSGGTRETSVGLDLACVVPGRASAAHCARAVEAPAEAGLAAGQLSALRELHLSPVARLLFDLDADVIGLSGRKASGGLAAALPPAARAPFEALEADGVVALGDLGLSEALQREALDALGDKAFADHLAAVRTPLPLLEQWLRRNATLRAVVAGYCGGHALLHGYKVVHLPATLTTKAFISAHWHHDRAGRRLKLFILLNDVDSQEGHPTQVAKRSHHLSYYWHEEFEQSRYNDTYVQREFETVRLAGPRGSGYIFDTNTIHKGTPEGSQGRNVIVVEYHQAAKCGLIAQLGLNIPCPSGDQRPLNWYQGLDEE